MVVHNGLLFKKIIILMIIFFLLYLTMLNGFSFYKILTDKSIDPVLHTPIIAAIPKVKNVPQPKTISRWHLMGEKSPKPAKVPQSTLRLNLIGIISSTVDDQSRAIIEISPRKHKYFKAGDEIKHNVKVISINADHIVIHHKSREEIVSLKSLKSKSPIIKKVAIK